MVPKATRDTIPGEEATFPTGALSSQSIQGRVESHPRTQDPGERNCGLRNREQGPSKSRKKRRREVRGGRKKKKRQLGTGIFNLSSVILTDAKLKVWDL